MAVTDVQKFEIECPDGVTPSYKDGLLEIKGPKGSLSRQFVHNRIEMTVKGNVVTIETHLPKRKDYAMAGTWNGHVTNMVKGVVDGYEYNLKMVYAHFPIKISVKSDVVVIENFLGERNPRHASIRPGAEVKVSGENVSVTGIDLEAVSQTAANIEQATKIKRYDPRVFQDGIYLIEKRR